MKNAIEFFYKMEFDTIKYFDEQYYLQSSKGKYIFKEYKSRVPFDVLMSTQNYYRFHTIIPNSSGEIITFYQGKSYILLRVNLRRDRPITLDDILDVAEIPLSIPVKNKRTIYSWDKLWQNKIDSFEKYIMNKDNIFNYREYYDYFIGLSENAVAYYKMTDHSNVKIGYSYNRIDSKYTLFDLYDPTNIIISPVMRGISEYIKSLFFCENKKILIEIEELDVSYNDMKLLISRLLFPTYFYDIFKKNTNVKLELEKIINLSPNYEIYLTEILRAIKKRHENLPVIRWLNQL